MEYKQGNRTAKQHIHEFLKNEIPVKFAVGGSKSEDNWRQEYTDALGCAMQEPPISDVEVGINRVYGLFKRGELIVFDTCEGTLAQLGSYSRVLDPLGNATDEIEDKATFHYLDMLRYIAAYVRHQSTTEGYAPSSMIGSVKR